MTTVTVEPSTTVLELHETVPPAELAAGAFLARYSGRTLESYRHDLRSFFTWAERVGLEVLSATRPQLELYVRHLEETGLAPSTIDRRVSTVCGFYRFAHVDGVIASNPAQYVRRPQVHPNQARGLDRGELAAFLLAAERCDQAHAALAVLLGLNGLRVSEACSANIEDLGFERGHRTLSIMGKGSKPAMIPLVPRTARTVDLAIGERSCGPLLRRHDGARLDRRTAHRWVRSIGQAGPPGVCAPPHAPSRLHHGRPGRRCTSPGGPAAARHADPRTTTIYDHRRQSLDHHAYVVVAFVTGG